jgi:hypothetical protein
MARPAERRFVKQLEDSARIADMRDTGAADRALAYGCVDWFRYPSSRAVIDRRSSEVARRACEEEVRALQTISLRKVPIDRLAGMRHASFADTALLGSAERPVDTPIRRKRP